MPRLQAIGQGFGTFLYPVRACAPTTTTKDNPMTIGKDENAYDYVLTEDPAFSGPCSKPLFGFEVIDQFGEVAFAHEYHFDNRRRATEAAEQKTEEMEEAYSANLGAGYVYHG